MIVYIWGNLTSDNFTPRPRKDTIGRQGQEPGLSASHHIPAGRKAQGIETENLKPPLRAIPDDPKQGGKRGILRLRRLTKMAKLIPTDWKPRQNCGTGQTTSYTDIARRRRGTERERNYAMSAASVETYEPVARTEYLGRLAILPAGGTELWDDVHHDVQESLATIETEIRRKVPALRATAGCTKGDNFFLFSYRTFSTSDSLIDPVVVGVTFTPFKAGRDSRSGRQRRADRRLDLIRGSKTVDNSRDEIMAAARDSASKLRESADAIVIALKNPVRKVE